MPAEAPENLSREDLTRLQEARSSQMFSVLLRSPFQAKRLAAAGVIPATLHGLEGLRQLPFTTKADVQADQEAFPPYGSNLTEPIENYCRLSQTSGTTGRPVRWLDSMASWQWMLDCWTMIFRIIELRPGDRACFPFSFGPFLGFWTAFDSAWRYGCLCLPAGGMSSTARLRLLTDNQANVLFCTPSYALHLVEVARSEGIDLTASGVRKIIVAGEPGGSIPATRARIEESWGARLFDHSGMTETGPLTIECPRAPGFLHVLESEHIAEVVDPATGKPVPPGAPGELVVTNLGRLANPLIRYRTGDLVCLDPRPCPCGRSLLRLEGGIRGRVDDMIVLRGNNVHPSALQTILHRFAEIAEYRVEVDRTQTLPVLRIDLEAGPAVTGAGLVERVVQAIGDELLFRAEVRVVPAGSLPRFEMKAQRLVQKNGAGSATNPPNC